MHISSGQIFAEYKEVDMLSGRENYIRTIEYNSPAYVPSILDKTWANLAWLWEKDESKEKRIRELQVQFPDDRLGALNAARNETGPVSEDGSTRRVDEWGTRWMDHGHGEKPDVYPLAQGYNLLAGYTFPDPDLPGRFDQVDRLLSDRGNRYVQGQVWFTLFERLWMLRGFENALLDPYVDKENFTRLRDLIVEFNLGLIDHWLERGVDAVYFSDDWGSQRSLLMNPDDWRKFYEPAYRRMFERVREGGAHVWMHLCGNISAILADLIDIGLNVLNPIQPQALDLEVLAREFGGKVCFNGGVDIQGTMVHGSPGDVRREIYKLVDLFGGPDGGYIGGTSHTIMPETPLDNVIAMYETFLELLPEEYRIANAS
jgi:uroporphyrinogen decarboxylase